MLFRDSRLKIERADKHILDFKRTIQTLHQSYSSNVKKHACGGQSLEYSSPIETRMFNDLSLILGDALHNFRCGLDYAYWACLNARCTIEDRPKFPFCKTIEEVKGRLRKGKIDIAIPRVFETIITDIKPYRGGNDTLYALHDLDITDKHKLLITTHGYFSIQAVVEDEHGDSHEISTWGMDGRGPLALDLEKGLDVKNKRELSIAVILKEGGSLDCLEVCGALDDFRHECLSAIKRLENAI